MQDNWTLEIPDTAVKSRALRRFVAAVGAALCLALNTGAVLAQETAPANTPAPVTEPAQNLSSQPTDDGSAETTQRRIQAEPSASGPASATINDISAPGSPTDNAAPANPAGVVLATPTRLARSS